MHRFSVHLIVAGIIRPRKTSPRRKKSSRKPSRGENLLTGGEEEGEGGEWKNTNLGRKSYLPFKKI